MDRSVIADVPRDKYVERCKQRAFDYLDRGDLRSAVAAFVNNMNARPDCELPHHLAALGVLLLMDKEKSARVDALQRRLKIERQLHEQEWQAQQRALEVETKRASGAERQTRMKSK